MTADQLALDDLAGEITQPRRAGGRELSDAERRRQREYALQLARQAPRRTFTITCVRLSEPTGGRRYWTARVTAGGVTVNVDRMYGSWHAVEGGARRDVLPHVAAELQRRVRAAERQAGVPDEAGANVGG